MDEIINAPHSIGHDIAFFRAEAGLTQAQVAAKAGVDQSRISRIEKGETGSASELRRIIDALGTLGSASAKDYRAYLTREWEYVERPEFRNPQRTILEVAEDSLSAIDEFLQDESRPWPLRRQLERQRSAIEASAAYLGRTNHQVAFIGEVGVGKSTAISFLYGLIDPAPASGDLRDRVVLETGGGRITLCEVNIRRGPEYGIVVQPQSDDEMRNIVSDFCNATWLRRTGDAEKNENVNVSEEIQRALRNMSGLTVKRERDAHGKTTSRDQALELAQECETEEEFRSRFFDKLSLERRTRREMWIEDGTEKTAMQQLRKLFRDINNGRMQEVPLPASIDILVPEFGMEHQGLTISAIDTKGLDEIAVRPDLDARLKDNRTHAVLCSTFNQAPSTSVQLLLDHLRNAHGVQVDTGKVSVLALPRDDEAMAVKDDSGEPPIDDEDGYSLKREQILRALASGDGSFRGVPILFFNAKKDDPSKTRREIVDQIVKLRKSYEARLLDECAAADEVIRNHETHEFTTAVQEVADRLKHFLSASAHNQIPPRVRQPSQEVVEAMGGIKYASTIWAMTRRNGEYYNFSVSHHVGAGGAKDALLRSKTWFEKLQAVLDTLKQDPGLSLAAKTIQQVETSAASWRRSFAEAARIAAVEVYRGPLEDDVELWGHCARQWGAGPGFKQRVERIIREWFENRTELNQRLETINAALWEEKVVRPLERLSDEQAGELPEDLKRENVIPFARVVSA